MKHSAADRSIHGWAPSAGPRLIWGVLAIALATAQQAWSSEAQPSSAAAPAADAAPSELWAGHQVVIGQRQMPVLGTIENRSDSFLLAEVRRTEQGLELRQRACSMRFKPVLGVKIGMPPAAVRRLPPATIRFRRGADGQLQARPWSVAWAEQDLDGDGKPGVTIDVESPWCSGQIEVASKAVSQASGALADNGLDATIEVVTDQRIMQASSWCLKAGSKDERLEQRGQVRYRPVPAGTTCEMLANGPWPVHVEVAGSKE